MQNHILVCGLGQLGYRIVELLHQQCETVTVLSKDTQPGLRQAVESWGVRYVEGDARTESSLREASIETARAILIVTADDLLNVEIALGAQRLNQEIAIVLRLFDEFLADRIGRDLSARSILSPALLTAPVFVAAALGNEILRAFEIGSQSIDIVRITFDSKTHGIGEPLDDFCERLNVLPLAVHWNADHHYSPSLYETNYEAESSNVADDTRLSARLDLGVSPRLERPLAPGDEIVVAASGEAMERLRYGGYLARASPREQATATPSTRRRMTASVRRAGEFLRGLRQTWRSLPPSLSRAAYALLTLIALSTLVFHENLPNAPSWIDSFYFVVTILTTVGFGDYNLQHAAGWLKLYGCVVMIGSTALLAILFGMITDVIVSRRVELALGRRPLKISNHVIVVGIGAVGSRVVQELNRLGDPVVAVTRAMEAEAIPELADSIPLLQGDANRSSILLSANVLEARAIIATSTDDLRNLRIAHQAETLNPNLRSVVRIFDTELAEKLSEGLSIDTTVNVATTAAATFAASALQNHVEQAFTLGNRLFLLRWLPPDAVYRAGYVGATIGKLQEEECNIMLRRAGSGIFEATFPADKSDIVGRGDWLLLLEEYFPNQHQSGPPERENFTSHAAL